MNGNTKFYHVALLTICLLALASMGLKAQEPSRFFYGGNVSISVSNYLDIDISPRIGYYLTPAFAMGVLAKYEFVDYDKDGYEPFKENTFGGGVFAQYDVSSLFLDTSVPYRIFLHTDYQYLYTETKWKRTNYTDYNTDDKWHIGAGFSVAVGGRSRFYSYISYDILKTIKNESNKYNKPVVSVGFQF